MNENLKELEEVITNNLLVVSNLRNEVEQKELEKQDQVRETALSIIDILDSFERIEEGLIEKGLDKSDEAGKIITRYKSVEKKLLNLLQKHGITKVEFPDNRLIVGLCEVVDTETDSTRKNDEIVSIVRNGFIRGKIVIRPAQIVVVKN